MGGFIDTSSIKAFVTSILSIINSMIIPLLITLGLIFFIWNLSLYVYRSNNEAERAKAKTYMIWSIIAMFLIFSIWGIIVLLRNTVGITNPLPQFNEGTTTTTSGIGTSVSNSAANNAVLQSSLNTNAAQSAATNSAAPSPSSVIFTPAKGN